MKKNILLTGASSDLGIDLIETLKSEYNLILIYNKHKEKLKKYVDNSILIHSNFTKEKDINNLINEINKKNVNIYALINMSAITLDSPIEEINMNNFTSSYKVNTYAPLKLITELKPEIAVNISSTDGIDTYNEYNIIYSLTKSSLIKLTEILSKYLRWMNFIRNI